jgi:hypothetical protein
MEYATGGGKRREALDLLDFVGDKSDEATHESEMKRPVAVREGLCETLTVISHVARIYLFIPAH